ncbi:hypothetical protein DQG13_20625 [Paenibacillus sp. YN15]|nr:hypothetical protein DQG13_20625 [Paenibacillus sp. YN15]
MEGFGCKRKENRQIHPVNLVNGTTASLVPGIGPLLRPAGDSGSPAGVIIKLSALFQDYTEEGKAAANFV